MAAQPPPIPQRYDAAIAAWKHTHLCITHTTIGQLWEYLCQRFKPKRTHLLIRWTRTGPSWEWWMISLPVHCSEPKVIHSSPCCSTESVYSPTPSSNLITSVEQTLNRLAPRQPGSEVDSSALVGLLDTRGRFIFIGQQLGCMDLKLGTFPRI